jgi:heterodisulfide reductase subunit B
MTVCNGCLTSLLKATEYLTDPKNTAKVNRVLSKVGKKYTGVVSSTEGKRKIFEPVKVRHVVDILYRDVGLEKIKKRVTRPMGNIRVAVHYGCHYLRPTGNTTIDDPHNPVMIDAIVNAIGAESVEYENKLDCCGAGGGVRSHVIELANALTQDKCQHIYATGADCIVTGCPFCLLQFDSAQRNFSTHETPVIHVTQFLALAMGLDPISLCFDVHKVSVHPLLRKIKRGI